MEEKEFKSLAFMGLSKYAVSRDGKVFSYKSNKCMTLSDDSGYYKVSLYNDEGKQKDYRVHRLVALAYIPNPDNLPEVNHKNYVRTDNRAENLEWCSSRYNLEYSCLNQPVCKYSKSGRLIDTYWSITDAARDNFIKMDLLAAYLRKDVEHRHLTYKGFIWCYEGDTPVFEKPAKPKPKKYKKVAVYIKKTPEEVREQKQQYYEANKEHIKAVSAKWKIENHERELETRRKRYERDYEKRRLKRLDPEYRDRINAERRERLKNDPEYAERIRRQNREYRERRKLREMEQ